MARRLAAESPVRFASRRDSDRGGAVESRRRHPRPCRQAAAPSIHRARAAKPAGLQWHPLQAAPPSDAVGGRRNHRCERSRRPTRCARSSGAAPSHRTANRRGAAAQHATGEPRWALDRICGPPDPRKGTRPALPRVRQARRQVEPHGGGNGTRSGGTGGTGGTARDCRPSDLARRPAAKRRR